MLRNDWTKRFKEDFFGSSFKLATSSIFPTAFLLLVVGIVTFFVALPTTFLFAKLVSDGMLIINESPDLSQIDNDAGTWAIMKEFFTFKFADSGLYSFIAGLLWLIFVYVFFLGYLHQVMFRLFENKVDNKPLALIKTMLSSLNGKSIRVAFLIAIISLITYIPVLLVQSLLPDSYGVAFFANMVYYLLFVKLILSPLVYCLDKVDSIPHALEYSWNAISWGSAAKILTFSFGFILFIIVFFFFASLVFTGTSIAVPEFAIPAFLFFMLMGIFVFTLALSAQYGLYHRYLPIVEEVEIIEELDENTPAEDKDDYHFPEYDDK